MPAHDLQPRGVDREALLGVRGSSRELSVRVQNGGRPRSCDINLPRARATPQRHSRPAQAGSGPVPPVALLPPRARRRHGTCSLLPVPSSPPALSLPPPSIPSCAETRCRRRSTRRRSRAQPWPRTPAWRTTESRALRTRVGM